MIEADGFMFDPVEDLASRSEETGVENEFFLGAEAEDDEGQQFMGKQDEIVHCDDAGAYGRLKICAGIFIRGNAAEFGQNILGISLGDLQMFRCGRYVVNVNA